MTMFDSLFCLAHDGWAEACETAVALMTPEDLEREADVCDLDCLDWDDVI